MNKQMHTFSYQGFDANGQAIKAYIHAEHILIAKDYLATQGIVLQKIRKALFVPKIRFNAEHLLLMTEQLSILIQANLPLIFCLNTVGEQFNPMINAIFKQIIHMIKQGKPLYIALQMFPMIFPHYFIYLIKVGEETGRLNQVLLQLTSYQQKMIERKAQLKKALLYPLFVCMMSLLITVALLIFIVPQFQLLFADMSAQLPLMTRLVFYLSTTLQHINVLFILLCFLIIFLCGYSVKHHAKCQHIVQIVLLYIPIVGHIIHTHQQIRYLRSLSVGLQAGLPLLEALKLSAQVMGNTLFAHKMLEIMRLMKSGLALKQSFVQSAQFCDIVIQLVGIGEHSSELSTLLAQSAQILEQRLDKKIEQMIALLQPLLIVILGIILGSLIIALYLPVFKLGTLY